MQGATIRNMHSPGSKDLILHEVEVSGNNICQQIESNFYPDIPLLILTGFSVLSRVEAAELIRNMITRPMRRQPILHEEAVPADILDVMNRRDDLHKRYPISPKLPRFNKNIQYRICVHKRKKWRDIVERQI